MSARLRVIHAGPRARPAWPGVMKLFPVSSASEHLVVIHREMRVCFEQAPGISTAAVFSRFPTSKSTSLVIARSRHIDNRPEQGGTIIEHHQAG